MAKTHFKAFLICPSMLSIRLLLTQPPFFLAADSAAADGTYAFAPPSPAAAAPPSWSLFHKWRPQIFGPPPLLSAFGINLQYVIHVTSLTSTSFGVTLPSPSMRTSYVHRPSMLRLLAPRRGVKPPIFPLSPSLPPSAAQFCTQLSRDFRPGWFFTSEVCWMEVCDLSVVQLLLQCASVIDISEKKSKELVDTSASRC